MSATAERVTFETATHADGPLLAEWLTKHPRRPNFSGRCANAAIARALHRWRHEGVDPEFAVVDRILTACGFHVSEVPEEVWRA